MMGVANDEDGQRRGVPNQFEHMARHLAWWKRARVRLNWEPIETLPKDLGDLALADPVILRSGSQWALGHWFEEGWVIVTAGGHSRLDHFKPFQWAEPTMDDHMLLAQE